MITRVDEIPITKDSYPFCSAVKYCGLADRGYVEKEYYFDGTANIYQRTAETTVEVRTANAPYVNRMIIRRPEDISRFSGHVVVEIINPTSFKEIDRMWMQGYREFTRSGDIYVGVTSKPNTFDMLRKFDRKRYERLSWKNPTPDVPWPFTKEELAEKVILADQDFSYETGMCWDILSDVGALLKTDSDKNPIQEFQPKTVVLTGWSQSANYLITYINHFAYRDGQDVWDGFLLGAPVRSLMIPLNQYESDLPYDARELTLTKVKNPAIWFQTESENGNLEFNLKMLARREGDDPDFMLRQYDVVGSSHDTAGTYTDYYRNDPDLIRIGGLPEYTAKDAVPMDYPIWFPVGAMFRNLFRWIETGAGPARCSLIETDAEGNNCKDALGNSIGGIRTCLVDYPTRAYYGYSHINKGESVLYPNAERDYLFGHEEPYPKEMLKAMYGTLSNYRNLCIRHTKQQISRGLLLKEDLEDLVDFAVRLAEEGGLED